MEIDLQKNIPAQATTPPPPQQSSNEQADNNVAPVAASSAQLSETSLKLSAATETKPNTKVDNIDKAQSLIVQFQKDAANEPSLTQDAQSVNVTSKLVASLIG